MQVDEDSRQEEKKTLKRDDDDQESKNMKKHKRAKENKLKEQFLFCSPYFDEASIIYSYALL